jgi:hypothetical protein
MRASKGVSLGLLAVSVCALLLCSVIPACSVLGGGHGGKNLTAPVTGLTATSSTGQVTLNWNAYAGASSYNVWRSTTGVIPTSGGIPYLTVNVPSPFTDTTVTNGTKYYYAVNANGSWGVSNFSNIVSVTP